MFCGELDLCAAAHSGVVTIAATNSLQVHTRRTIECSALFLNYSLSVSAAGFGCSQARTNICLRATAADLAMQTWQAGALRARAAPTTGCTLRHLDAASRAYA